MKNTFRKLSLVVALVLALGGVYVFAGNPNVGEGKPLQWSNKNAGGGGLTTQDGNQTFRLDSNENFRVKANGLVPATGSPTPTLGSTATPWVNAVITNLTVSGITGPAIQVLTANASPSPALRFTGVPKSVSTIGLLSMGSITGGNSTASTGGTYIAINEPASGAGSTADIINAQQNGSKTFGVTGAGALTAASINGNTITTGTGVLTIAAAKTLTVSNTLTLAGTDSTTLTFPSTSATIARTDAAQTFTGQQTFGSAGLANQTSNAAPATPGSYFVTATFSASQMNGAHVTPVPIITGLGSHTIIVRGPILWNLNHSTTFTTASTADLIGSTSSVIQEGGFLFGGVASTTTSVSVPIAALALTVGEGISLNATATTTSGNSSTVTVSFYYDVI